MLCGHRDGSEPGGNRETKYVREPRDSTLSCTNLFRPWMMLAIEITEDTPITMPRTVSTDRTFDDRRVSRAARQFSRACEAVMIAISQPSLRRRDPTATRGLRDRYRKTVRLRN